MPTSAPSSNPSPLTLPKRERAQEVERAHRELQRTRREPLRIVIAGDPRRPIRTIAIPARLPGIVLVIAGGLVLTALGLGIASYMLRGAVWRLKTRVSAMVEAADSLARHPLPVSTVAALDGEPQDTRLRVTVKPERSLPPERQGHLQLESVNNGEALEVTLDLATGEPDERSYRALRHFMRCLRTGAETPIDPRIVELLFAISRRTGQKILLVSGFRAPMYSTAKLSYHTRGMAADIRIPGMTPLQVRDLVMSMGVKGVGYYPVSQFVHVDVREEKSFWTDYGHARGDEEDGTHGAE
jgi:uncharacterized protein YcbK (DUF882 family)